LHFFIIEKSVLSCVSHLIDGLTVTAPTLHKDVLLSLFTLGKFRTRTIKETNLTNPHFRLNRPKSQGLGRVSLDVKGGSGTRDKRNLTAIVGVRDSVNYGVYERRRKFGENRVVGHFISSCK
jgi:hypothetical protein